jgi:flagellar L-ring protein precursor FlgH
MMARLALVVLCLLAAAPARAQSLWREGAPGATLFADNRARAVNDIITILVVESASASRSASTSLDKQSSRTAAINELPGLNFQHLNSGALSFLQMDVAAKGQHAGKGSIDSSDQVTTQIAARVVKVLDNGNLVIEGRRAVLVNDDTQTTTVSGVVRPQDLSGANTVLSTQVMDAEIQLTGRGILADTQRPGIIYRFLDWLHLF